MEFRCALEPPSQGWIRTLCFAETIPLQTQSWRQGGGGKALRLPYRETGIVRFVGQAREEISLPFCHGLRCDRGQEGALGFPVAVQ